MNEMGEFAKMYGSFTFIVEVARDGVYGRIDDVRLTRLVDVLNYVGYTRSEVNLANDRMKKDQGYI